MHTLRWNQKYATGVEAIDLDHRELFAIYNDLYKSILRGESDSLTATKLEQLLRFTREHFAREEELMKTMRYPGLELHLERHKQLAHQVQEMMQDFLQGKTIVNLDALQFLHGWVSQHTLQEDPEIHLWRQKHDQQP